MTQSTPIVRGEAKSYRVTFMDADSSEALDTTGWNLRCRIGRTGATVGDVYSAEVAPDPSDAAQGKVSLTIDDTVTAGVQSSSVVIAFDVDAGGGWVSVIQLKARVMSDADYRQMTYRANSQAGDVPVYISGAQPQEINVLIRNDIDPTFDIGVQVRFNEIDPDTLAYLQALQADVTQKHTEVMSV